MDTVTVLNNMIITQNYLSVAQASSYFKNHDMHITLMHATPTFLIEALYLVTYV